MVAHATPWVQLDPARIRHLISIPAIIHEMILNRMELPPFRLIEAGEWVETHADPPGEGILIRYLLRMDETAPCGLVDDGRKVFGRLRAKDELS